MQSTLDPAGAKAVSDRLFANEADPAFKRRAGWLAASIMAREPGGRIDLIDIGCGRGFHFPLYRALGAAVTGVEADPEVARIAAEQAKGSGASVLCAPAERLPATDASFDVAVMSEIIEHLDDPVIALREAHRVLRSGGLLLVTVPNADYPLPWDPINWLLEALRLPPIRRGPLAGIWANHVRLYTRDRLRVDIEAGGFRLVEMIAHTHRAMPFIHNIVYGLGKPLLEAKALPAGWLSSAERGRGATPRRNPVGLGIRLIQWFDRANPDREPDGRSTVNLCVRAVKP